MKRGLKRFLALLLVTAVAGFGFLAVQGFASLFGEFTPINKIIIGIIGAGIISIISYKFFHIKLK